MHLQVVVVVVSVELEVASPWNALELFDKSLGVLHRKNRLIVTDAVVLNDLVDISVPHHDVHIQITHLRNLNCLANQRASSLAL